MKAEGDDSRVDPALEQRAHDLTMRVFAESGLVGEKRFEAAQTALVILIAQLLAELDDPAVTKAVTLAFEFDEGGRLREIIRRGPDGRLLACLSVRPDGSVVPNPE